VFTAKGSILVKKPIDEVFAFLSNVDRYHEWQHSAYDVNHETGGSSLGHQSRVKDSRNILGKKMDHTYEVVEHTPPTTLAIRTAEGPVPFTFKWSLERVDGGTRINGLGEGEWDGSHDDLTVAATGEKLLAADLATIKELLEK
jgi:polyketide cyclase/dehydrase/lipid transport protein